MKEIIGYITKKYRPSGIIVYGSYADGSNSADSDFDALVISDVKNSEHDTDIVCGVRLDVFVYSADTFDETFKPEEFRQLYGGRVIADTDGTASKVLRAVGDYYDKLPKKTPVENAESLCWCEKMLLRAKRGDAEGFYRYHWLLTESLEIYYDLIAQPYPGPKKGIKKMREDDPAAYALYERALSGFAYENLAAWVEYLKVTFTGYHC